MNWREHFTKKADIVKIQGWINKIRTMNNAISFDADNHKYRYMGNDMISVSERLEYITPDMQRMMHTEVMKNAAERGTAVHYFTEQHDKGVEKIDLDKAHEDLKPYLRAYLNYLVEHAPMFIGVEMKVAVKQWLTCGTIDRVYVKQTKNGKLSLGIMDIKTGGPNDKHAFQIFQYAQMLKKVTRYRGVIEKTIVYIKGNGQFEVRRIM